MGRIHDLVSVAALKRLDEDGLFGPKTMLKFLDLDQPRRFGTHYNSLEIDGRDVAIVAAMLGMREADVTGIFRRCSEKALETLSGGFARECLKEWESLDLFEDDIEIGQASFAAFAKVAEERAETFREMAASLRMAACRAKPAP